MQVIKFKNYGLDLIEVEDNGSGISSDDYDQIGTALQTLQILILGLKHYTSKLSTFENLEDLETFGFRGEAISSLCALAQVKVLTATRDEAPRGTKLKLDHSGVVIEKKVASSKVCPNSLST